MKDAALWASLAAMATAAKELNTAEIAYAAINETEKVEYISYIKEINNKAARNAEMSLFCKQTGEAEGTLLQAGLIYRAIRLNIDLFKWNRLGGCRISTVFTVRYLTQDISSGHLN